MCGGPAGSTALGLAQKKKQGERPTTVVYSSSEYCGMNGLVLLCHTLYIEATTELSSGLARRSQRRGEKEEPEFFVCALVCALPLC